MRIDVLEEELARLDAEGRTPKFIYTVPSFQNPAGRDAVARAPAPAGRDRAPARAARARGQPVRDAALRGRAAADAVLARRRRVRDLPRHVLEDPLARPAARLDRGAAARARQAQPRQGRRRPVLLAAVAAVRAHSTSPSATGSTYVRKLTGVYRRRRDIMLEALAEHFPREATWTRPQGGLFIWARLPDYIDTTDLLARALRDHVAFVPGRAAYLDGRGGSEMRLNFSGVGDDEIREGIRRIGEVVREQVALYGTLTGRRAAPGRARPRRAAATRPADPPRVLPLRGARPDEGRGPQGRRLARAAGLAALGRARRARARPARPRGGPDRRRPGPRRPARRRAARRGVRGAARPRRRGRHGPGAARAARDPLHGLRPVGLHPLHGQGGRQARAARRRACRRPTSTRSARRRSRSSAPRGRCRRSRSASTSRSWSSRPARARRSGSSSPRTAADVPGRDRLRVLLRHQGPARAPRGGARPRGLGARGPGRARGAADRGGRAARGGLLRLRGPLRDRPHGRSSARPSCRTRSPRGPRELALDDLPRARLLRLRARRPDARRGHRAS